jgi:transposase
MVATKAVDFRKGAEGLAALVRKVMRADPFDVAIYVFRAKRADRVKLVFWDGTGVCLFAKRLEDGQSADVLANLVKLAPTATTGLILDVDNRLDALQMRRQSSTIRAPLARRRRPLSGRFCLSYRGRARLSLLEVFEREQH